MEEPKPNEIFTLDATGKRYQFKQTLEGSFSCSDCAAKEKSHNIAAKWLCAKLPECRTNHRTDGIDGYFVEVLN